MRTMDGKVLSQAALVRELDLKRQAGARIVFTNGCFDLLHVGHTRYLQAARKLGDVLVVGVNTDRSVRGLKKGAERPIVPDSQRAEVLAALACVDYVVLFDEPDPYVLIRAVQPDVLAQIRNADALLHVARAFEGGVAERPADPWRDVEERDLEFTVADLDVVQKRLERLRTAGRHGSPSTPSGPHVPSRFLSATTGA